MPIITKCKECGRTGRYGKNKEEELCAKCEIQTGESKPPKGSEKSSNQAT